MKGVFWTVYFVLLALFLFSQRQLLSAKEALPEQEGGILFSILLGCLMISALFSLFLLPGWQKRDKRGKKQKQGFRPWHLLYMLMADSYCFFMMEYVNNPDFSEMEIRYRLLNIAFIFIIHLILLFWLNSYIRSTVAVYFLWTIAALVFYFVYAFRGEPFQLIDIFSVGTAAEVAGAYVYKLTAPMVVMILGSLSLIAVTINGREYVLAKKTFRRILIRLIVTAFMIGSYFFYLNVNWNGSLGILTDLFSPIKTYKKVGTTVGFFCVAKYMRLTAPEGYSEKEVQRIADESLQHIQQNGYGKTGAQPAGERRSSALIPHGGGNYADGGRKAWYNPLYEVLDKKGVKKPVNIIAIMNESLADYNYIGKLQTNEEVMPYFDALKENAIKGHTLVCITGGGTAKTEYEFLTGNSVKRFPGMVPYVSYFTHDQYSLVTTLEAQGFDSAAMHPYKGSNWKRPSAYALLNFDRFYTQDDFSDQTEKIRGLISDRANYQKILEVLNEKKNPKKPFFLFNITMQNHGGYANARLQPEIQALLGESDEVNTFLTLERKSDDALRYLIETLKKSDIPTLVLVFGDHYPTLPDAFLEGLSGKEKDKLSLAEEMHYYATPFVIWANYDIPEAEDVVVSTNFLGTLLLQLSGYDMADYNHYLKDMMYTIPALNHLGYLDTRGEYHSWKNAGKKEDEKELEYERLQYNNLAKKGTRLNDFFGPPGESAGEKTRSVSNPTGGSSPNLFRKVEIQTNQ